jgi:hypothetical protein
MTVKKYNSKEYELGYSAAEKDGAAVMTAKDGRLRALVILNNEKRKRIELLERELAILERFLEDWGLTSGHETGPLYRELLTVLGKKI